PEKSLLRRRACRGHSERYPTPYRTFLARPGIAEASRKCLRRSLAIACRADRGQGLAPSRQGFHPSALVVGQLRREPQEHRCCLAKARERGRTSPWPARNPAVHNIDNKPR